MRPRVIVAACGVVFPFLTNSWAQQPKRFDQKKNIAMAAKPLILEKAEGELRTRRPALSGANVSFAASQFVLKFSPKNNASQQLVVGTEQLAPGARIRAHRHLRQDEILLIQNGTAHVELGDQQRDIHAGGLVFIPANTRIALQNIGADPIDLVFVFSAPGYEDYMRCVSVPAGQPVPAITRDELRKCSHQGHVVYDDLQDSSLSRFAFEGHVTTW